MTRVSVVVPWRPDPARDALWRHLRPRWEHAADEVIEGTCDGPWRKALALHDAIRRATGDVLVVADADVWCDRVDASIADVAAGRALSVPHLLVHRLTEAATRDVLAGTRRLQRPVPVEETPYRGRVGGGLIVIRRDVWDLTPMDPRFVGWGHEDEAWCIAFARTWGMPIRHDGDLYHLWHPPQERLNRAVGSTESLELFARYAHKRTADAVIAEAREEIHGRRHRPRVHRAPAPT